MLFNSYAFVIFFPIVATGFFLLPQRARTPWLLLASYVFYGYWKPAYLVLIAISTLVDYVCGRRIHASSDPKIRKRLLIVSLVVNLGILFFFKYLLFVATSALWLAGLAGFEYSGQLWDVVLPVGISFYTFQSMGYTIDVYREKIPAERSLLQFALYVSFFPQLVAGPIERAGHLLPELRRTHRFSDARAVEGLRLVLWGFIKKVVIADRLALYVNMVYGQPEAYSAEAVLIATAFFAVQIYCDFSGYTDIARGVARLLGVRLMRNFNRPYIATSIRDFWHRWHISLSTWFRDYVYIPLGGSRHGLRRTCYALAITFLLSGLWHGANWTFVVWGAIHGGFAVLEFLGSRREALRAVVARVPMALRRVLVVGVVCFAWVFFRAESLESAGAILGRLDRWYGLGGAVEPTTWGQLLYMTGLVMMLQLAEHHGRDRDFPERIARWPLLARWFFYIAGALAVLYLAPQQDQPFIYFQF